MPNGTALRMVDGLLQQAAERKNLLLTYLVGLQQLSAQKIILKQLMLIKL